MDWDSLVSYCGLGFPDILLGLELPDRLVWIATPWYLTVDWDSLITQCGLTVTPIILAWTGTFFYPTVYGIGTSRYPIEE